MAKIPFDIKFRPQIESGEYKVETLSSLSVTIYRWDFNDWDGTPIMGSYVGEDGKEYVGGWDESGHFDITSPDDLDLFIVTPEQGLSEFELKVKEILYSDKREYSASDLESWERASSELLDLARKELEQEGPSIIQTQSFNAGLKQGKVEVLKDLPRWRKWENGACGNGQGIPLAIVKRGLNDYKLVDALGISGEQYIMLSDLEKLPGFKED